MTMKINENKIVSTCIPAGKKQNRIIPIIYSLPRGGGIPWGWGGSRAHPQRAEKRHFMTNGLEELTDINIYAKYIK